MPVIPSFLERVVMLNFNQAPGVFVDMMAATGFQAVMAAIRLGLFETLNTQTLTPTQITSQLQVNKRGIIALLDFLVPLGYVDKTDGGYANTAMTKKWLLKDSPTNIVEGLEFWSMIIFDFWSSLDKSIQEGEPQSDLYHKWLNEGEGRWAAFQDFMITGYQTMADEIITKVKIPPTAQRLLDVGGGHGLYSIAFCEAHPQLSATVFDLPEAVEIAQQMINKAKAQEQVSVQGGDIQKDVFGNDYDVILLFNLVHTYLPEKNQVLLNKVAKALKAGGMVVILEQFAGAIPGSFAKVFSQAANVNFFHMVGGKTYTADELTTLLKEGGFVSVKRLNLRSLPGNGLIIGTKPATPS